MFQPESGPPTSSSVFCHVRIWYFRCVEITIDISHRERKKMVVSFHTAVTLEAEDE